MSSAFTPVTVLPDDCQLFPVKGDGFCYMHAILDALESIGASISLSRFQFLCQQYLEIKGSDQTSLMSALTVSRAWKGPLGPELAQLAQETAVHLYQVPIVILSCPDHQLKEWRRGPKGPRCGSKGHWRDYIQHQGLQEVRLYLSVSVSKDGEHYNRFVPH